MERVYLPVFEPKPLVVGQQVVQLLDVSQARQEHQDGSVHAGELRRLVCGRHVQTRKRAHREFTIVQTGTSRH